MNNKIILEIVEKIKNDKCLEFIEYYSKNPEDFLFFIDSIINCDETFLEIYNLYSNDVHIIQLVIDRAFENNTLNFYKFFEEYDNCFNKSLFDLSLLSEKILKFSEEQLDFMSSDFRFLKFKNLNSSNKVALSEFFKILINKNLELGENEKTSLPDMPILCFILIKYKYIPKNLKILEYKDKKNHNNTLAHYLSMNGCEFNIYKEESVEILKIVNDFGIPVLRYQIRNNGLVPEELFELDMESSAPKDYKYTALEYGFIHDKVDVNIDFFDKKIKEELRLFTILTILSKSKDKTFAASDNILLLKTRQSYNLAYYLVKYFGKKITSPDVFKHIYPNGLSLAHMMADNNIIVNNADFLLYNCGTLKTPLEFFIDRNQFEDIYFFRDHIDYHILPKKVLDIKTTNNTTIGFSFGLEEYINKDFSDLQFKRNNSFESDLKKLNALKNKI